MKANIPETSKKRVVIVGGGFGGLKLATKLTSNSDFQVVLLDKNNYHQFQPLFYQVATASLEPSSICFPFRKVFQKNKEIHIRVAQVSKIVQTENYVETDIGKVDYDFLVLAMGGDTNFFGNKNIEQHAVPMKSVSEALALRNRVLQQFENAVLLPDFTERQKMLDIVIVGGGPTGVEVAGALAELKTHILPKDYPELNFKEMDIFLIESSPRLLNVMSEKSSLEAKEILEKKGVTVLINTQVQDYIDYNVVISDGRRIPAQTLIWAAGIIANAVDGLDSSVLGRGRRVLVDEFSRVKGSQNVFCVGDMSLQSDQKYPNGYPQVAPVAMQQAEHLEKNLNNILQNKPLVPFVYFNQGSMATIGRNKAVVDLPFYHFKGFFAWLVWMALHLVSIIGIKNRVLVFINWTWNYITYDQSLRLIIKPIKIKDQASESIAKP